MSFNSANSSRKRTTFSEINITPLTDVFLVLLVVMFLIAPLLDQQASLKINPPGSTSAKTQDLPEKEKIQIILIEIDQFGKINLNNKTIVKNTENQEKTRELIYAEISRLTKNNQKADIKLLPDQVSKMGDFISVYDAIAQAKLEKRVRNFSLLVKPIKKSLPEKKQREEPNPNF